MILPTRTLFLMLWLPLGLAVVAVFETGAREPMLIADLAIVAIAALDALLGLGARVSVRRDAPTVLSLGRPNKVRLTVESHSRRSLKVRVTDDAFEAAQVRGLPVALTLPARGRTTIEYAVVPERRGAYALGDHWARIETPLGLWVRARRLRAEDKVRVYPDLHSLRAFDLLARQQRELEMVRAIRRRGGESEFERLRDYARDDEYRAIDWKATARRQKLTAREYQLESNQSLVLMLDGGRLMTAELDGLSRFDHALNAALMLAHLAVRGGDRVGLLGFDDDVRAFVAPTGGPAATRKLVRASYALHPRLVEPDFERAFAHLATRVRRRSLVVLFTHITDDAAAARIARQARAAARRHLPLLVLFRDLEIERLLSPPPHGTALDLYISGAAAETCRWRDSVLTALKRGGAHVLHVGPHALTTAVVNRYLEIKARKLL